MQNPLTSIPLIVLIACAAVGSVLSLLRMRRPIGRTMRDPGTPTLAICTVGGALVLGYRWLVVSPAGLLIDAHVDGLLLIATLFAATVLYIRVRARVPGIGIFALPVLAVLLAWALCASAWTYHPFAIDGVGGVWAVVHLGGVYVGTFFCLLAAIAGAMYLYVNRRLRNKDHVEQLGRFASLETLERLNIQAAALGFGILTLGLVTGVILVSQSPGGMGDGWWYSPKVVLAFVVWGIYAVVMNVRHTTSFRGVRAAWLSIVGVVLLVAVYAIVNHTPAAPHGPQGAAADALSAREVL